MKEYFFIPRGLAEAHQQCTNNSDVVFTFQEVSRRHSIRCVYTIEEGLNLLI
ncbi:hypothetical protein SAMN05216364_10881 [Porphyromonadaceae bacterium KHP3R9]|nr:hypothetical protein SAMN05216364_10881 [Porphyromonadaceae bacterium KHP3R9]